MAKKLWAGGFVNSAVIEPWKHVNHANFKNFIKSFKITHFRSINSFSSNFTIFQKNNSNWLIPQKFCKKMAWQVLVNISYFHIGYPYTMFSLTSNNNFWPPSPFTMPRLGHDEKLSNFQFTREPSFAKFLKCALK